MRRAVGEPRAVLVSVQSVGHRAHGAQPRARLHVLAVLYLRLYLRLRLICFSRFQHRLLLRSCFRPRHSARSDADTDAADRRRWRRGTRAGARPLVGSVRAHAALRARRARAGARGRALACAPAMPAGGAEEGMQVGDACGALGAHTLDWATAGESKSLALKDNEMMRCQVWKTSM